MALLIVAFIAGVLTVLSPCVLPLLPIVVGGSLAGGKSIRRAVTVTVSLGVSVFLFTLLLKVSTALITIPQAAWNWLSGGILFFVGVFYLFPNLWDLIPGTAKANRDSTKLMSSGFMKQSFWGDVVVGAALGPVFSTCSPTYFIVLATVLPASFFMGVADIVAYILGLCLFLFVIAIAGQALLEKLGVAADPNGWLRKTLGILFMAVAVLIVTGLLAKVEAPLYDFFDATKIEQRLIPAQPVTAAPEPAPEHVAQTAAPASALTLAQKAARYATASELVSPDAYLNTNGKPITLASLRGKVVLLDFWTYSCINCQRTLPYLKAWYAKYKGQGLVVLGVHTPEFAFEHLEANVAVALQQFGLTYPVVLDNEYQTWNAYGNQYWPHEYVIDMDGYIVHDHIGEGAYDETEAAIQAALAERAARLKMDEAIATSTVAITPADLSGVGSPETYFGSARNRYLANGTPGTAGTQTFTLPASPAPNALYLGGTWDIAPEYAVPKDGAAVLYRYQAKNVYLVAAADAPVKVEVREDGTLVRTVTVSASMLYPLIENGVASEHTLELRVKGTGLKLYTFTFG